MHLKPAWIKTRPSITKQQRKNKNTRNREMDNLHKFRTVCINLGRVSGMMEPGYLTSYSSSSGKEWPESCPAHRVPAVGYTRGSRESWNVSAPPWGRG